MRFLVDAQLPPALAEWLKGKGFEAEHVFDRLGPDRADGFIAEMARAANAIVVSKDADFLSLQVDGRPQVVWVALGNSTNRTLLARFEAEWPRISEALSRGDAVVELD